MTHIDWTKLEQLEVNVRCTWRPVLHYWKSQEQGDTTPHCIVYRMSSGSANVIWKRDDDLENAIRVKPTHMPEVTCGRRDDEGKRTCDWSGKRDDLAEIYVQDFMYCVCPQCGSTILEFADTREGKP